MKAFSGLTPGSKKGGFGSKPMSRAPAAKRPADAKPSPEEFAAKEREVAKERRAKAEKKERDEVNQLKERLSKGHRLNDDELAQLEMAAVARWNQLQREDEEADERQREAEAEKERKREQRLAQELKELRSAAAADRANLERAGAAVADELREMTKTFMFSGRRSSTEDTTFDAQRTRRVGRPFSRPSSKPSMGTDDVSAGRPRHAASELRSGLERQHGGQARRDLPVLLRVRRWFASVC